MVTTSQPFLSPKISQMSDTKNFCKQKNSERYRHFSRVYALSESREEGKSQASSLRLSSSAFAIHISLPLPCDYLAKKRKKKKRKKKTAAADQENLRTPDLTGQNPPKI